ncbi:nuclear receptor subfamily 2 group E member 1 [Neocloeon triangulifer]|uniref:nuclear receptor subfamily 2 group E member 1 n=1 Tax=Neocloeon triangulifer TaxID=2078957 RepID=UPI00286F7A21|nr:nuclear receptor subfamily 2 group E member 1 [Neocloeon triangulifer]
MQHPQLASIMDLRSPKNPGTSSRILYDIPCKVCQDHSSGKHYGIFACDGCAGFFKRSIRRNRQYVCKAKAEGACLVDKTHRNQCRACRLRKCVEAGMNKDAVQHERGPRNSTIRRQMSMFYKDGPGSPPLLLSSNTSSPIPGGTALDLVVPKRPSMLPPTPPTPPGAPGFMLPKIEAAGLSGEAVCEVAARLLFMNVKWARSLPAFTSLSLKDQLLLLEQSWRELFVLGAVQFSLPLEPMHEAAAALGVTAALQVFIDTQNKFRIVGVDHNEYACLRALILFKTGNNPPTLRDVPAVSVLQDSAQLTLSRYITCGYPGQPFRFGKLLLLLPALRSISNEAIETLFFRRTIGDISIERIICDMYKNSEL